MKLNSFAQNLKALCEKKEISRNRLSTLCGFSSATVPRLVKKGINPRISTLVKLAEVLDVSLDELIRGDFLREWVLQKRTLRNKAAFKPQDNFAKNFKILHKNSGLTNVQIAEFLEVTEGAIEQFAVAKRSTSPSLDGYIKIADFFAVTIDELICGNAEDTLEMWSKRKHLFESLPLFERS